jgi:hypothetical protein
MHSVSGTQGVAALRLFLRSLCWAFLTIENGMAEVLITHQICIGMTVAHHLVRKEERGCTYVGSLVDFPYDRTARLFPFCGRCGAHNR